MSLKNIEIGVTKLSRGARVDVAAYIICNFDERISRRAPKESGLYVTPYSFVQIGLKDSGVSIVHNLL
jgi:hypothetical protein